IRDRAGTVTTAIANNAKELQVAVQGADLTLKSKAWNDKKVDAHHAIIPTPVSYTHLTLPTSNLRGVLGGGGGGGRG
ncbi:hypothetical protein, partial [Vibrio alginolyticus]|uniref:hypothetical protein n=1 Tax=Vibrio alginolyticus TaxID=663 RepID=UPI003D7DC4DC